MTTPLHTFSITAKSVPTKPNCWDYTDVTIYNDGTKIGSYTYQYPSKNPPFYVFRLKNNWYALYATSYMYTRIMSLPDCKDIGGEENEYKNHFCPVEYYVPVLNLWDGSILNMEYAPFGFVSGCVWGDDSSWKLQYLDLSRADEGIVKRDQRFGYFELPSNVKLKDCIDTCHIYEMKDDMQLYIAKQVRVNIDGSMLSWYQRQMLDKLAQKYPDMDKDKLDELKRIFCLFCNRGLELTTDVMDSIDKIYQLITY